MAGNATTTDQSWHQEKKRLEHGETKTNYITKSGPNKKPPHTVGEIKIQRGQNHQLRKGSKFLAHQIGVSVVLPIYEKTGVSVVLPIYEKIGVSVV